IKRLEYHFGISEIRIHLNNTISEWEIDHLRWLEYFKRQNIQINLVIYGEPQYQTTQDKLSIIKLSHLFGLWKGKAENDSDYREHLSITLRNGDMIGYISDTDLNPLSAEWAMDPE